MNRIKPDGPNLKPTSCPYCDEEVDHASCIEAEGIKPKPGDVTICFYCGEPCKLNEQLQMEKLEGAELAEVMSNPVVQTSILYIKARKAANDPERSKAYSDQLDSMAAAVKTWRDSNGSSSPSIQYNFQKGVAVIAPLEDAIKNKFMSVNDDAMIMFKDLGWLDDKPSMPTVLMVRTVLEHVFGKEE